MKIEIKINEINDDIVDVVVELFDDITLIKVIEIDDDENKINLNVELIDEFEFKNIKDLILSTYNSTFNFINSIPLFDYNKITIELIELTINN